MINVWMPGQPKGQPRPRAFVRGKHASVYNPATAEGWKSEMAIALSDYRNARISGPVRLSLEFYLPRPKGHYRTNGALSPKHASPWHMGKPDADNLVKAVMDCLTRLCVWWDDAQVVSLDVDKLWARGRGPGCQLLIVPLTDDDFVEDP